MSQVPSWPVLNGTGAEVRQRINDRLAALLSANSGSSAPPNAVPGMLWLDTSSGELKIRNAANTTWLPLADFIVVGGLEDALAKKASLTGAAFTGNVASTGYIAGTVSVQALTASGTWTKPANLPGETLITVEVWGAGGGGGAHASGGGGGGGGYNRKVFKASDLGATVAVTIGAGGASGAAGGNTTFGSHLTGYGGGAGANASDGSGGGGGGVSGKGGNAAGSGYGVGGLGGGGVGRGAYVTPSAGADFLSNANCDAGNLWGGGGGGVGAGSSQPWRAGHAIYGGGGGAGSNNSGGGGVSPFAGDGGASGSAGVAPAGGGGRNAAGARGECRVHIGGFVG